MTSLRVLLSRLAALFRHRSDGDRLSEEIETHLALLAAEFQGRGLPRTEAMLAARREFGGALRIHEIHREQRALPFIDTFAQDLGYAFRQLLSQTGFSAAAILTLAFAIGANTAIFPVFDAVVLRPLPVPHPEQLVVVDAFRGGTNVGFTYPLFRELAARQQALAGIAAVADLPVETFDIAPGRPLDGVTARLVSGDYFAMLRVPARFGRRLSARDDQPSAPAAAVISDSFWHRAFSADPAALGCAVRVNGASVFIAGIAPPGFFGETIGRAPDLWIPISKAPDLNASTLISRGAKVISVMARLRGGVPPARAETALAALYAPLDESFGMQLLGVGGSYRVSLTAGGQGFGGLRTHFAQPLWILTATVGVVLLIACCNLANLLMARATARTHEIGVRLALGVSRGRLFRQLLTESLLLVGLGAAIGLPLAWWGSRELVTLAVGEPWRISIDFGWRILGFTAAVSAFAACLFGLAPAIAVSRLDVNSALRASRRTQSTRGNRTFSKALVVAQISLSLLLVSASALLARSFWNLLHRDFGYRPDGVVLVDVPLDRGFALGRNAGRVQALTESLQSLPAVRSVALETAGPLSQWVASTYFATPDRPASRADNARRASVSGAYFETLRIPILAGRAISAADCQAKTRVAVLSETAALGLFGHQSPIGRLVSEGTRFESATAIEVIGVARDVCSLNPRHAPGFLVYRPRSQDPVTAIELRASGDPRLLVPAVRRVLDATSGLGTAMVRPLWDALRSEVAQDHLLAVLSGAFGVLALLLASVGLYGVIAYTVERRTQEIGIRMALGATGTRIAGFLMREAGVLIATGLITGGAATLFAARWLRALLFGIPPRDPVMLAAAALVLSLVAAAAAFIPARRAARLDPTETLRRDG